MLNFMVKSSVERLIRNGIIKESERELYYFGVNGLCLFLVNIATSVIIGILFGMLWQSLLFSAAYIPLRSYAGGYHAKTPGMCYILSTILIACVLMVIKYAPLSTMGMHTALLASMIVIFVKAPIESENKPLSKRERAVYRRKARWLVLLEISISLIAWNLFTTSVKCIIAAVGCCAMMIIFSSIRQWSQKRGVNQWE
ncbi:MAG: accessory gene regulator B family protein [Clostridia bacterium]